MKSRRVNFGRWLGQGKFNGDDVESYWDAYILDNWLVGFEFVQFWKRLFFLCLLDEHIGGSRINRHDIVWIFCWISAICNKSLLFPIFIPHCIPSKDASPKIMIQQFCNEFLSQFQEHEVNKTKPAFNKDWVRSNCSASKKPAHFDGVHPPSTEHWQDIHQQRQRPSYQKQVKWKNNSSFLNLRKPKGQWNITIFPRRYIFHMVVFPLSC